MVGDHSMPVLHRHDAEGSQRDPQWTGALKAPVREVPVETDGHREPVST